MKVVILAGGIGTRISEESHLKPKPMIEIGGMPEFDVAGAEIMCENLVNALDNLGNEILLVGLYSKETIITEWLIPESARKEDYI